MNSNTTHMKPSSTSCVFFLALVLLVSFNFLCAQQAFAVTSEELYAEAEGIMQQIDILQTSINEEEQRYEAAMRDREEAIAQAQDAQRRIEEEQVRLDNYKDQLATVVTNMYKTGGNTSFLEVVLGAASFEEFLTQWDALSSISGQGAHLVNEAKAAKAAEEQAWADFEHQQKVASTKMNEAAESKKQIEEKQDALREEAEKITEEAAELEAIEELEREAAKAAAAAAAAMEEARKQEEKGEKVTDQPNTLIDASGLLFHPLPSASVSSGFGYRDFNGGSFHMGLDLAAPHGTDYMAAARGTVIYATYDGGYNGGAGNWIVIAHGNGLVTKYMHSSKVYVKVGETVDRGQVIGAVGNTGESFGPHLHFQVEYNGVAVNPLSFL